MAMGFFRRRQKMVMIIMAVLMVSFLISFQGFDMLMSKDPAKQAIGKTADGTLTYGEFETARYELSLLRDLGLGNPQRMMQAPWPTDMEFFFLERNQQFGEDKVGIAFALLLKEADKANIRVTQGEVDDFFAQIGLTGARYDMFLARLQARDITEKSFRRSLGDWLRIQKAFQSAVVQSPPSEIELQQAFRDFAEKVGLCVVKLPAEKFVDQVSQKPTDAEILEQYNRLRGMPAGMPETVASFGFGYLQPDRASVDYLLVDEDVIRRVAKPSEQAVMEYYLDHKSEFVNKVPASPTPAIGATPPASPAEEVKTVAMTPAEAKVVIVEKLADSAVRARTDKLVLRVQELLSQTSAVSADKAYDSVRQKLIQPADALLARKVMVRIENEPLDVAMNELARAADVQGICFPWGKHGDIVIEPSVRVTLKPDKEITLADALDRVAQQILVPIVNKQGKKSGMPSLRWATCDGFDNVLFPLGELETFPVVYRHLEPMTPQEMLDDPILGQAFSSPNGGRRLVELVFTADAFKRGSSRSAAIRVGEDGPRMYVTGPIEGQLVWRLTAAIPQHEPPQAAQVTQIPPAIFEQVTKDIRLAKAFGLAEKKAEEISAAAAKSGLPAAAKSAGYETITIEPFARRDMNMMWHSIKGLEMPYGELFNEYLVRQAFSLVPENIEPPLDPAPRVRVVPVPPMREAMVFQLTKYVPPATGDYQKSRLGVMAHMEQYRQSMAVATWFDAARIGHRLDFVPENQAFSLTDSKAPVE
jgi:hypothetical protein